MSPTCMSPLRGRFGGLALTLVAFAPLVATLIQAAPTSTGVRSVYMNGTDISSARNQNLKNVDIHINENGDIFIVAPHYQVNEEDTYVPLSKFVQGINAPSHKPPQAANAAQVTSPKAVEAASEPVSGPTILPKAGQSTESPAALGAEPPPPALPEDEPKADGSK